ncbi:MAG TPA: DUF3142 domain-containing protein, partial [Acidobacteriaceae bacterium]|nr:DUF3142 domain-containing protein [Acidobacteriaceae bacterium]
ARLAAYGRDSARGGVRNDDIRGGVRNDDIRGGVRNDDIRGGVHAIQIDFDATQSQQPFYRGVLEALRPQLPRTLPLSITALVSWCGPHSWLHTLPIDEAVPMEFRMGGPRALAFASSTRPRYAMTEPLCRTSLGLSTDEPWPASVAALNPSTRVYLFAPRPWRAAELTAISTTPLTSLAPEIAR